MALPSTTNGTALTTPTCVSAWVEYPFRNNGDPATKAYHHLMQVKLTSYAPLADDDEMTAADEKPDRSPFPDDANAFFTGDSMPEPIDGGMVQFVRSFSQIPATRTEGAGLYAHEFPSNADTPATFDISGVSKSGGSSSPDRPELSFTANAADSNNIEIGDIFVVGYNGSSNASMYVRWQGDDGTSTFIQPKMIVFSKVDAGGGSFTIEGYLSSFDAIDYTREANSGVDGYRWTVAPANLTVIFQKSIARDNTLNENSESFLTYRYVKTDDINSERFEAKFATWQYISPSGIVGEADDGFRLTDTLSSGTSPSIGEYNGLVFNQSTINAEPEVAFRWRGNIWEIVGRKVVAK